MLLWCQPLQPQLNAAQKHSGSWPREKKSTQARQTVFAAGSPRGEFTASHAPAYVRRNAQDTASGSTLRGRSTRARSAMQPEVARHRGRPQCHSVFAVQVQNKTVVHQV